ncbi:Serine protease Do-like HtrA [compost metagenome]
MDLSITKIQADGLEYVTLGDSSALRAGETVYAIGNPIGYEFRRTVTSGIISATNRTISFDENTTKVYMSGLIQTDATINPGNSGGPLILPNGVVIGINTVKITSAEGIGFAVPINVVKGVINKITSEGEYESGSVGIFAYDKDAIKYLSTNLNLGNGIYVAKIISGGAASKTDLREGDIINEIDGKGVNTMNQFKEYVYIKKKGDSVKLNITRGKLKLEISVTLQ